MFTQYSVNELISHFNKIFYLIFFLLFIAIITHFFATESYADTQDEKDSKVRKAVINQLLILDGKAPKKEKNKNIEQEGKDNKRAEETTEQPIVFKGKLTEKTEKKEAKPIKATVIQSVVTPSGKSTEKPKEKKPKLAQPIPNTAKKKQSSAIAVKTAESKKIKQQATPLVEVLSDDEMQVLMSDFMQSSDTAPELQASSSKLSPRQSNSRTNLSNKEQSANNSDESEQAKIVTKKESEKSQQTSAKTTTVQKNEKTESQIIPVGRTRLGRNTVVKASTKTLTGWIYLGRFAKNKWESQTLDVEQLPKIGKRYAVKATMVNLRTTLPKKGVMGKAIKVIKNKAQVKIIQLRSIGRNREHYWARIER